MNRDPLARLLAAARRRRIGITLALALPWMAATAAVAWRSGGTNAAAAIGVLGLLACAALAWHRGRTIDHCWLQRRLDARHAGLEDSTELLVADPSRLAPLAALQRGRVLERLPSTATAGVRAPWPRATIAAGLLCASAITAIALLWPDATMVAPAPGAATAGASPPEGPPILVEQALEVTPPAYTGLTVQRSDALDARVPEGSRLAWKLRFEPVPEAVALEFLDGRRVELLRQGDAWAAQASATTPGLYRIVATSTPPGPVDALHRIDVVRDLPPSIRITAPEQTLSLRTPGQRYWTLAFEATDDHGVAASADMHLTMTEGSGENIGFRDEVRRIGGRGGSRNKRFTHRLDLDGLGLSEGDDLIVHVVVRDNRPDGPQATRSASHILRWPPPGVSEDSGIDGILQRVLPAYFSSQRQIIIDAEALIAERPRLAEEAFAGRSDTIAVDQRLLRLRYGQFLGEESEGVPTAPVPGTAATDLPPPPMLLPTNDAEDEAEAWRERVDGQREVDRGGTERSVNEATAGHDHGEAADLDEPGRGGFGVAGNVLEEFGHVHDIPEAATLLDPKTRALLRRALGEMWQSELALRQARPQDALPPANRALALVKEIQQADRIHLARTGTDLPPVDFSRRLRGEREGIRAGRSKLASASVAEDVPAALWRALSAPQQGDTAPLDLDAFQSWLSNHDARVPDPLALLAALDALQRDPGCASCRREMRALLWPLVTPPPAAPRSRAAPDAEGRAYLDALRGEAAK